VITVSTTFDIRSFHDTVLNNSQLPPNTLAEVIDEWIATQLPSPTAPPVHPHARRSTDHPQDTTPREGIQQDHTLLCR
jgi:hypothetical protein